MTLINVTNESDSFYFVYDSESSLADQSVYIDSNFYILNVSKIYTNNVYFGVLLTTREETGNLYHVSRTIDDGYSEEIVDNKTAVVNLFLSEGHDRYTDVEQVETISVPAEFHTDYNLAFVYDTANNYCHSTIEFEGGMFVGWDQSNTPPTAEEAKTYLIDQAYISASNVFSYKNTAYSSIKVYEKTEI